MVKQCEHEEGVNSRYEVRRTKSAYSQSCNAVQLTYDHRQLATNGHAYIRVQARLSAMAVQHAPHDNTG